MPPVESNTTRPAAGAWEPYQPDADAPWDLRRAVHLHRRAGFAATWREIRRDLADDPQAAVGRVLAGKARADGVLGTFAKTADLLGNAAAAGNDPNRLKAWWLYRCYFTPDPLAERLTLVWHNHFATGNQKVADLGLMRRQNDTLRRFARAPFGELLGALLRDPALLVWLDAPENKKSGPNENLGREVMELFTLGVGNYTEADVKEAARALTGRSVGQKEYRDRLDEHDDGEKIVLGRRGRWGPDDLAKILLDHPATPRRLAMRVCEAFLGERAVDAGAVEALATGLRDHDLDLGWAVETVLRSRAFFAPANLGTRVADPVEFVAGPPRALERFDPPPSTVALAEWVTRLGQDLFYPPTVGGWAGGRAWMTSRAIVGRANFAGALVRGELSATAGPPDLWGLADRHERAKDLADALGFYSDLLLGGRMGRAALDALLDRADAAGPSKAEALRPAVARLLARPEAQLS